MRKTSRERVLRAAADVVARDGVRALTLDAVAAEAKVSKGGLLYHFNTKQALISALVDELVARFEATRARYASSGGPGANTKAYLLATFDQESREIDRASAGVLAALADDPTLLEPLRSATRRWQALLEKDDIDPVDATIVRLAVDGLWFSQLLRLDPLSKSLRAKVLRRLSTLARGGQER